jgi:hypothetical protein
MKGNLSVRQYEMDANGGWVFEMLGFLRHPNLHLKMKWWNECDIGVRMWREAPISSRLIWPSANAPCWWIMWIYSESVGWGEARTPTFCILRRVELRWGSLSSQPVPNILGRGNNSNNKAW